MHQEYIVGSGISAALSEVSQTYFREPEMDKGILLHGLTIVTASHE